MRIIYIILGVVIFAVIGFLCLAIPEKIQEYVLKNYKDYLFFKSWVTSIKYIWSLRIIGFFSLISSFLLIMILLRILFSNTD